MLWLMTVIQAIVTPYYLSIGISSPMATHHEAIHRLCAAIQATSSPSNTGVAFHPSPPDLQQLFMGTTITVDDWFKDFESYVDSVHHGKVQNRQWFSILRNLCVHHPGLKSLLDSLDHHERDNLRHLRMSIRQHLFPHGQPQAVMHTRRRYYQNLDMPNGDNPLAVLAVHRQLLMAFPDDAYPSHPMQVQTFMEAISGHFRTMLAPFRFRNLDDIEHTLRQYYNNVGPSSSPSTTSSPAQVPFQPSLIFAASGGGDVTRNPVAPDVQALLHQLRTDLVNDVKQSLAPHNVHAMSVETGTKRAIQHHGDRHAKYVKYDDAPSRDDYDSDDHSSFSLDGCEHCYHGDRRAWYTHQFEDCTHHPNKSIRLANRAKYRRS